MSYRGAEMGRSLFAGVVLVGLFALLQGLAWGQSGQKAVAGQAPAPVQQGQARLLGSRAAGAQLSLNVDLSVRESAQLRGVIAAASTPGSASYGRYLTEGEYMARYAPTDAQVAAVESWLSSQGLQVAGASKDNLLVHVQGSTAAIEQAFTVSINDYAAGGKEFYANDRAPSVPADLAVAAVSGLSDYYKPVAETSCFSTLCGYNGNDLRAAYDIAGTGEGQTIAYTLWGKPLTQTPYKKYAEITKTPELIVGGAGGEHIEFKQVGEASTENQEGEIALDTESAHVVAPGAHHVYFLAHGPLSNLLETALDDAAESEAKVISNSWGAEVPECNGALPGTEAILEKGAALGKTFFFSSGDFGAARGCTYPDSSQFAVAVGGTALEVGEGSAYKKEIAIKNGGNCNNGISRPSWQTGIGTPHVYPEGACSGRVAPDVSALSCGSFEETVTFGMCFLLAEEGGVGTAGGTSLAAPVWAAAATVWNKNNAAAGRPGIGFVAPLLYALGNDPVTYARDFHDVTEGSNGFPAAKGWDEATGWGSPNLNNLANNEAQLSYTGATETLRGTSVTLSATLTDKGSSQPLSGRTVRFAVDAESCEAATNAGGAAACAVTINDAQGAYTLTARTAATTAYLEASTSATFTVAEPPIFGRCLKVPGEKVEGKIVYHGEFTTATCTEKSATHTGKFEWFPGRGPKTVFRLALKPLTTIKIETPGKHALVCTGVAIGEGIITGLNTVEVGLILNGCTDEGEKCGNVGEGEVEIFPLFGKLGWQNKALKKVDLQFNGSGFVFSSYKCPKKEVLLGTTGILLPVTVNKFSAKATDKFTETKGKQVPSALEGGPTLFFEEDRINFEPPTETIEGAGLSATLLQTYEEPYEINTAF